MPPYGFSWVVPNRIAGLAAPSALEDLIWLRENGIELLMTLTEDPLPKRWINDAGMMAVHIPIPDFEAPSPRQLELAIDSISKALKGHMGIAVHCQAGKGRTGTILAAYFVSEGLTPTEAIKKVRSFRPGSIETSEQERAIEQYSRLRDAGMK